MSLWLSSERVGNTNRNAESSAGRAAARARYRTTHCSLYCADLADLFYLHAGTHVECYDSCLEQERWKFDPVWSFGVSTSVVRFVPASAPGVAAACRTCVVATAGVIDSRVVASERTTRTCNFGTTTRSRCFRARPLPAPGYLSQCHGPTAAQMRGLQVPRHNDRHIHIF